MLQRPNICYILKNKGYKDFRYDMDMADMDMADMDVTDMEMVDMDMVDMDMVDMDMVDMADMDVVDICIVFSEGLGILLIINGVWKIKITLNSRARAL